MPAGRTRGGDPAGMRRRFEQIERDPSLSDKVAEVLIDSIVSGELQTGDRLPSERELIKEFEVSRSVVREAMRSLVAKGLVRTHARSGYIVTAPESSAVSESMTLYLRGRGLDYSRVIEVREVLELAMAERAAERATKADVDALRAAAEQMRSPADAEQAALADIAFHRAIADATGNEFFRIVLESLREVLLEAQLPALSDPATLAYVRRAHGEILDRIAERDPVGARTAMSEHLAESRRRIAPMHASVGAAIREPGRAG